MGVARYPRYGERIAPGLLAPVLHVPAVIKGSTCHVELSDLDETAWTRFRHQTCVELGEAVICQTRKSSNVISSELREERLPSPPSWVRVDDLNLDARTYNRLEQMGLLSQPQDIGKLTLGAVLKVPSFGIRCLVDLLCCLESFVGWVPIRTQADKRITSEARKLRRLPHAKQIRSDDPRFGAALRAFGVPARNLFQLGENLVRRKSDPTNPAVVIEKLRNLRKQILSRSGLSLQSELADFTRSAKTERDSHIVIKYFGWAGHRPRTLEDVGEEYGMTRERVRQLCEKVIGPTRTAKPFAPTLDRALRWIRMRVPARTDELESNLVKSRFVDGQFSLESLQSAAIAFGREPSFWLDRVAGYSVAVPPNSESANLLFELARKSVSRWGLANIEDLSEQVKTAGVFYCSVDSVAKLLSLADDFRWLDQANGWFWLTNVPRNSLLTQIKKIFAVMKSVRLPELRSGVARHHRRKGFAPPRRVLAELCRQLGWCEIRDEIVTANPQPAAQDVLSRTELQMFDILHEHGAPINREQFEKLCRVKGIKQSTFYVYLGYSPIFERYVRGVYGLRGAPVDPGQVQALRPKSKRRPGRVLVDYGWTKNKCIFLVYRLSEGLISSGVGSIPASMRRELSGEYELRAADGLAIGKLVIKGSSAWGLLPFFRRRGGDVGDYMSVVIELNVRRAVVSLGGGDILDELFPAQSENENPATRCGE